MDVHPSPESVGDIRSAVIVLNDLSTMTGAPEKWTESFLS